MGNFEKLSIKGGENILDQFGNNVFHVTNPHALMQAVGYLKHTAEPWERIYMRGQSCLHSSLSPSLYRGITKQAGQSNQHTRISNVTKEFCNESKLFNSIPEYAQEPLLQHYGIKTSWLDIVDNIWVALWFACHEASTSGKNKQYMHFDTRDESSGENAYIILIKTGDDRRIKKARKGITVGASTEVVDLRIAVPSVFLRPHAQHGLLFRVLAEKGGRKLDYSSCIEGIIRFPLEAGKSWLGAGSMHTVRSLFPPPAYDSGYEILLRTSLQERSLGLVTHIGA